MTILFMLMVGVLGMDDCSDQYLTCLNIDKCVIQNCSALVFAQTQWNLKNATLIDVEFNIQNQNEGVETFTINGQFLIVEQSLFQQKSGGNLINLNFQVVDIEVINSEFVFFQKVFFKSQSIHFKKISMNTNQLYLNSLYVSILHSKIKCHQYKCLGEECLCNTGICNLSKLNEIKSFQEIPHRLEDNYTLGISSNETNIINSQLYASAIGIYAHESNISIDKESTLNASGLGCREQQGFGCGFYDSLLAYMLRCGSSGGSYGGEGGKPKSEVANFTTQCQKLIPREIYGNPFNPLFEGSGGGGNYYGGYGGGVIYIQGNIMEIDGIIEANGGTPDKDDSTLYGAGSGGSIQLRGLLYGNGTVSVKGGMSSSISGAGGGGRIFFNDPLHHSLNLFTGDPKGTIYHTSCPVGYGIVKNQFKCILCPEGYYSFLSNTLECKQCINFSDDVAQFEISQAPICKIKACKPGKIFSQQQCVDSTLLRSIGGENVLFGIIVFVFLLLTNFFIFLCRLKRQRSKVISSAAQSLCDFQQTWTIFESASEDPKFLPEDLPYFVKRLYIQGNNTPQAPWQISSHTTIDKCYIKEIVENINQRGIYKRYQRLFLIILKIFYFPFYYFLLKYYQKQKFKDFVQYMIRNNKINVYCLKLSNSVDYTLAYIDVLNYNINILDWNKSTSFPISLVLSGNGDFIFPWQINLKDPLVKSMKMSFEKQQIFIQPDDEDDELINQSDEDEIRSFNEFIALFNQLMLKIDIRKGNAEFIKNCFSLFEFVDESNRDIFSPKQIYLDICFHILGVQQSSLIILSTQKMMDLQQTLRELHYIFNYKSEYQIKVSVNFDKFNLNIKRYYDNQIIVNTINDINRQITIYQRYEEDKEELNNLKLQMQRKIEADGILTPLIVQKLDEEVENKQQQTHNQSLVLLRIQRFMTITFAFFLRYRSLKSEKRVTMALVVCCLTSFILSIMYQLELVINFMDEGTQDKQLLHRLQIVDYVAESTIFPLSQFISEFLLVFWLLNPSNKNLGKSFLLFNFCAIINHFVLLLVAIFEIAVLAIMNLEFAYYIVAILKIVLTGVHILQGYLGSKYLQS